MPIDSYSTDLARGLKICNIKNTTESSDAQPGTGTMLGIRGDYRADFVVNNFTIKWHDYEYLI